jgi:hypothetical protein
MGKNNKEEGARARSFRRREQEQECSGRGSNSKQFKEEGARTRSVRRRKKEEEV